MFIVFILAGRVISLSQDKLIGLMDTELKREMDALTKHENPPYYLAYRISDINSMHVEASFGNLTNSESKRSRVLTTAIRVGSYDLDNTHEIRGNQFDFMDMIPSPISLPLEDNPDAIRQAIWNATNKEYTEASEKFAKVKANVAVKVQSEDSSADFSKNNKVVEYIEPPINPADYKFDLEAWKVKVKKFSAVFLNDKNIYKGGASIKFTMERKYFVSSEGTKIAENYVAAHLMLDATIKSDDGMELLLYKSYFAYNPEQLPSEEQIIKDANEIVNKLKAMRTAPVVAPYSGPAILSGRASGVFFHEIFGHRVEGHRQKKENEGQTFKKKVGELILPESMTVYSDPSIKNFEGFDLNGYYKYDDEGVNGSKVVIVDNGIMKDFLMSRNPIANFYNSNGHGRAQEGYKAVSRQSNLIVSTTTPLTKEQLRQKLINECKKQNKEYGYYFEDIMGGFTMTGRTIPNAFNVMPTEVYRVYVDGRPDELVRGVDLVGTPLSMFSHISDCGDKYDVFNGTCGAESGGVPVSCASPSIFVKQIEVQKKSKSQEKPPILPRPGTDKSTP
jgi:predicted Zn-dependent protease